MKYSDNAIATTEDFAKMAKEYNARLKKEKLFLHDKIKINESSIKEIIKLLNSLIWLYDYIKKNIHSEKLKSLFSDLENESRKDLHKIKAFYKINNNDKINYRNSLKNFFSCLKIGISVESELIKIFTTFLNQEDFMTNLIVKHLNFIKKLASL